MSRILLHEETLDPAYMPPRLVRREKELSALSRRYRESLGKAVGYHHLLTGGIGSGKTALANRLGDDLERGGRLGDLPVRKIYVNCWRRSNDRTILLFLLREVGVSLPDRGYSLPEMLDVFEQGIRKAPRHLFIVLDEAGALVRQETKLVYLLTRSPEVGLGSVSLFLIATEDILSYLDAASRSSFGVTHRMALAPYGLEDLREILRFRAGLALRPGAYDDDTLTQVARVAATGGDARLALEVLAGAARTAEADGRDSIAAEDVRAAKGSIYPTLTEEKLADLNRNQLFVLLAIARNLRGRRTVTTSESARQTYQTIAEGYGITPMSRVSFWRIVKELDREGLLTVDTGGAGQSARLSADDLPATYLETLLESQLAGPTSRKA
ncbi:MAG: AAA family ATPase [Thermoplasmata archaeon]